MKETLAYYNQNAKSFIEGTLSVPFNEVRERFLRYLMPNAHLLDFGCGSGRDAKCFLERGFQVDAVDGSMELCEWASKYAGIPVKHMLFQDLEEVNKYDGIWACASILHLPLMELKLVMKKIAAALKEEGFFYTSFKYGEFEGVRNGRHFTDMTELSLQELVQKGGEFAIKEMWVTSDVREERKGEKWVNAILQKRKNP